MAQQIKTGSGGAPAGNELHTDGPSPKTAASEAEALKEKTAKDAKDQILATTSEIMQQQSDKLIELVRKTVESSWKAIEHDQKARVDAIVACKQTVSIYPKEALTQHRALVGINEDWLPNEIPYWIKWNYSGRGVHEALSRYATADTTSPVARVEFLTTYGRSVWSDKDQKTGKVNFMGGMNSQLSSQAIAIIDLLLPRTTTQYPTYFLNMEKAEHRGFIDGLIQVFQREVPRMNEALQLAQFKAAEEEFKKQKAAILAQSEEIEKKKKEAEERIQRFMELEKKRKNALDDAAQKMRKAAATLADAVDMTGNKQELVSALIKEVLDMLR